MTNLETILILHSRRYSVTSLVTENIQHSSSQKFLHTVVSAKEANFMCKLQCNQNWYFSGLMQRKPYWMQVAKTVCEYVKQLVNYSNTGSPYMLQCSVCE